jgi:putative ATPase
MATLFSSSAPRPLADRLRPKKISEIVGQDHLLKDDGPIARMLKAGRLASIVLWGPPGCGKTTLARLLAEEVGLAFEPVSAVTSGVVELRKVFEAAEKRHAMGQGTLLFVDEIHRFNRAQQDAFLPFVEQGTVTLVGATTENPSFEINGALLSRAQVLVLNRLDDAALDELLKRAEEAEGKTLPLNAEGREMLKQLADGDGRYMFSLCEDLLASPPKAPLDAASLVARMQKRAPLYDKGQESHYNLISALHKALRGSDVDAALYWFARMIDGGEDPHYIARRLLRFASEDVGLAEPAVLERTLAAWQAYERLGTPEGELALAQAVIDLARAPKSNAAYVAWGAAKRAAKESGSLAPPMHAVNAPTKLMQELGYSEGYEYDHDAPDAFSGLSYFPDKLPRQQFYHPTPRGREAEIGKYLEHLENLRREKKKSA